MKLVEILARELNEWPSNRVLSLAQAVDGDVIYDFCSPPSEEEEDYKHSGLFLERAEDWVDACVTRAQWEAERARIAAMDGVSAVSQEQANEEAEREKRTQYEQELWDKVAASVIGGLSAKNWNDYSVMVEHSMGIADAFMAERAKRLKK